MREDRLLSAKCRNLLTEHADVLQLLGDEIRREQEAPITHLTVDEIALEYKYREGIKQGLILLVQKINNKADVRE